MDSPAKTKTAPKRLKFTKAAILKLPTPAAGRVYWHDSGQSGLTICCSSSGTKTFVFYKWVQGKPERVRLGSFPDLSVENARDLAKSLIGDIAMGKDPMQERRRAREVPTVREAFVIWRDAYAKQHRKSWQDDERQFNLYLRRFHARRLSSIRSSEVALWQNAVKERHGLYTSNRAYELLRTIYNQAKQLIKYTGGNPCDGVRKFKEQTRDRFLAPDEMPRFFASLAQEPNQVLQAFFYVALLTGARKSNVEAMRWEEIDWTLRSWRIPSTKAGVPIVVPLCDAAIDALRKLKGNATSEWVFPGRYGGHVGGPGHAWRRLLKRAGIDNLRIHDLRRSLGSWQAIGGSSLPVIGRSLGHASIQSTMVYARLTVDPVRESVEKATTAMLAAGRVSNGNTVNVEVPNGDSTQG
jgi:integrase